MSDKPMSCPWCENQAFVESNGKRWRVWHDCGCTYGIHVATDWHKSERDAVTAWNNRVIEHRIGALKKSNSLLKEKNAKLCELVCHLMYVKPREVSAVLYEGKVVRFDDLLEEVGLRWEYS